MMVKLTFYELTKLWRKKAFLWGVLALLLVNFLLLFIHSQMFEDTNAPAYKALLKDMDGLSMEEKQSFVGELYRRIEGMNTIDSLLRLESYGGSDYTRALREENAAVIDEFWLSYHRGDYLVYTEDLGTEYNFLLKIKNELEKVADYEGYLDGIFQRADSLSQISIFKTESGDSFSEKSIRAQAGAYGSLRGITTDYLPEAGIMSALEFRLSDVLLIVFVLLAASVLLREEKDSGMLALNFTMPKGRGISAAAKIFALQISLLACVCGFYIMNLAYYGQVYGLGDLLRPVQSLPSLLPCPWRLTIAQYLLLFMAAKWLGGMVTAVWLMLCTYIGKNIYTGWALGLAFMGLNYWGRMEISAIGPWNLFRCINIFGFMDTNELLGTATQLYFFGDPLPILWTEAVGGALLCLCFALALVLSCQKGIGLGRRHSRTRLWAFQTANGRREGKTRVPGGAAAVSQGAPPAPDCSRAHASMMRRPGLIAKAARRPALQRRLWQHERWKLLRMNGTLWILLAFFLFTGVMLGREPAYKSLGEEIYKDYMTRWGGRLTEQTVKEIQKENESFEPLYALEDALALGQITSQQYEALLSLQGPLQMKKSGFDRIIGEKLEYLREHPSAWLVYDSGYEKLFDLGHREDIFEMLLLLVVLIFGFGGMFSSEKMKGMDSVLAVTPLGQEVLARMKIRLSLRYGAGLAVVSLLPRYVYVGISWGFPQFLAPAQSLPAFSMIPGGVAIYHMMLLQMLCRILVSWSALCVIHWLSGSLKNTLSVFFCAALLLVLCPFLSTLSLSSLRWLSLWPLFHFPAILAQQVPPVLLALYSLLYLGLSVGARDHIEKNWGRPGAVGGRKLFLRRRSL